MSITDSFLGTFLPFPASRNVWSSRPLLMPQSQRISLLQLSHGMRSGIPLTFQICTHTVLAEALLFFSNTVFSFLFLLGERLSSFENWGNWQKSCGGIVMLGGINECCQPVPYFIWISEWSRRSWQAASGRLPLLPFFFPLPSSWKLRRFLATNARNTSWSFWVLHLINPKITPQPQAVMESSRYSEFSLFRGKEKKSSVLSNNFSYQTYIFKDIRSLKKHQLYFRWPSKYTASWHMEDPRKETSVHYF